MSFVCRRRLSSSVTLPSGGRARRRARGRSGGRHCTAGQYGYVQLGRHLVLKVLIAHMNDCSKFTTTKWSVERYCAVFSTFWSVIVYWGGLSGDRWLQCVASACRIIFLLYIWYLALSDGQADANWSAINRVYVITRCPPRHWLRRRCSDVMAGATSLVVDESFDHQRSTKAPTTRQSQP